MNEMTIVDWIAYVFVVLGALNWALMIFDINAILWLSYGGLIKTVYALIGLSALWMITKAFRI